MANVIVSGPRGPIGRTGASGVLTTTTSTQINGLLKGDGSTVSAATAGTDYVVDTNYFRLTADGSGITTIADFFGSNDGIPMALNGRYEIEWHCYFTVSGGAGTMTWTIVNTQSVTNMVARWEGCVITGIGATGAMSSAAVVTQTAASVALPVTGSLSAASHWYKISAVIEQSTAGNVRLRSTMSANTATPLRDSWFRVRKLPTGNIGTFVA